MRAVRHEQSNENRNICRRETLEILIVQRNCALVATIIMVASSSARRGYSWRKASDINVACGR